MKKKVIRLNESDIENIVRRILKEDSYVNQKGELKDFDFDFDSLNTEIELYYEKYMKFYDVVNDYKGLGYGTIFGGDSGYIDEYDDLIERLKDDIGYLNKDIDVDTIEFVNTGNYLETFIKGFSVTFE